MKKSFIPILLIVFFLAGNSALFSQEVISAAGDHSSGSIVQVSWTLGEPVIETGMNGQYILTQGMHQGNLIVTVTNQLQGLPFEVKAYPNPVSKFLKLDIDAPQLQGFSYSLFNIDGQLIHHQDVLTHSTTIPMESYAHSSYLLRVNFEGKEVKSFRVVKNK